MEQKIPKISETVIKNLNNIDIVSSRLRLKKFSHKEIEFNMAHELDTELMSYIRDVTSVEETLKKNLEVAKPYSGNEGDWLLIALRLLDTEEYIGIISFRYESIDYNTVEIGWRLDGKFHDSGYASEAALRVVDFIKQEVNPHKLIAYCVAENIASAIIMEKIGMSKEGCLKQAYKINNKWYDCLIYGLVLDN